MERGYYNMFCMTTLLHRVTSMISSHSAELLHDDII